jgi:hypothetical protein
MHCTSDSIPRSGLDRAPGSAPAPQRLQAVRQALTDELEAMAIDHGLQLETGADPDERILRSADLDLNWLCDFIEAGLKRVVRRLPADLIGGTNVTRLDRVLTHGHPRLPYRRALRIVGSRGWRLPLGEDLPAAAQASLVRFCGLLPVQVMFLAGQPAPDSLPGGCQGVSYVLPFAGEALRGECAAADQPDGTVCRFRIDRLLQFVLAVGETEPLQTRAAGD